MIAKFYYWWAVFRYTFMILAVIFLIVCAIKGHTFSLEFEYIGPGSEFSRLEREYEAKENERARERCDEGRGSEKDYERGCTWDRDHAS